MENNQQLNRIYSQLHEACSIHEAVWSTILHLPVQLKEITDPQKQAATKQITEFALNAMVKSRDEALEGAIAMYMEYKKNASPDKK